VDQNVVIVEHQILMLVEHDLQLPNSQFDIQTYCQVWWILKISSIDILIVYIYIYIYIYMSIEANKLWTLMGIFVPFVDI